MQKMSKEFMTELVLIPGPQGFWKCDTAFAFRNAASVLRCAGFSDDMTLKFLRAIYRVVKNELRS